MDLGIVIVNWNVRDLLAACLDSVYADLAQGGLASTVVVVDNGSQDGSTEMLRTRFPGTRLIEEDNRGMGAGNNLGMRVLMHEHAPFALLILNPDTIIRPGALRQLVATLRARPEAGVVAPKLLNPDGSLQHSGFRFPGLAQAAFDLFPPPGRFGRLLNSPLNGRYPKRHYAARTPFQVDHTLGAAFVVRAEAVDQCGMFDETFHMYCEEIDWQWRMARAGWERWVDPAAEIVHFGAQSTKQIAAASLVTLWTSRRRLYFRYYTPALNAFLNQLVTLGMRRQIRANHRLSQRGQLDPNRRAELNKALNEIIQVWQRRRPTL